MQAKARMKSRNNASPEPSISVCGKRKVGNDVHEEDSHKKEEAHGDQRSGSVSKSRDAVSLEGSFSWVSLSRGTTNPLTNAKNSASHRVQAGIPNIQKIMRRDAHDLQHINKVVCMRLYIYMPDGPFFLQRSLLP